MDRIKELEQKIASLKNGKTFKDSIWNVLDERMAGISNDEAAVISARESVKTAQADMMYAFVNFFLFPKYRDEFSSIPAFRPICDKYITEVVNAKEAGVKHSIELEEENRRLKEELARLKK